MTTLSGYIEQDATNILKHTDLLPLSGKTIAVTGASGLVGLYLIATVKAFNQQAKKPCSIIAITHSKPEGFIKDILTAENITVLTGDLTDDTFIQQLPSVDFCIHAAGYGQPAKFMEDQVKTIKGSGLILQIDREHTNMWDMLSHGVQLWTSLKKTYIDN